MVEITRGRRSRSLYFLVGVMVALLAVFAFLFISGHFDRSETFGSTVNGHKAHSSSSGSGDARAAAS